MQMVESRQNDQTHTWPGKRGHAWVTMAAALDKYSSLLLSRVHLELDDLVKVVAV